MKILKLLNRKNLSIFIFFFSLLLNNLKAEEEPVDIWDLEKKSNEGNTNTLSESEDSEEININTEINSSINTSNIVDSNILEQNKISIVGLYDPEDNGLNIEMWSNSNGNEIKLILNKLNKTNLSKDAKEIFDIALLTNAYFPRVNITEEEFIKFKLNYLIKNNDKDLIKKYLIKNENNIYNSELIIFYLNDHLENADLENACKLFDKINYFGNDYINKFKIYCLINQNQREKAQLLFDLSNETGLKDKFFENKFNILMKYIESNDKKILDQFYEINENIIYFHLKFFHH